jgi:serine/threonine protein kinase
MEYLPSRNLADILAERDALPPEQVADIGRQLASALAAAHAEGIVHRDVTPGNVLITPTGTVKIADFGISRSAGDPSVTGGGFIAGTPAYLAPEVAGGAEAGFASDVFSLGATLYRALEGKPPFGLDDNPITLLLRVAREEVEPPAHDGPLADVLTRVLQRDPEERPTMAEVCELLAAVAEDRPLPPPRPPRRTATRRLVYSAAAGVFLLAVGVLIGTSFGSDSPPVAAGPAPLPAPSPTQTSTSTSAPADSGCTARYQVTSSWPGGYQVEVTVRNGGAAPVSGWTVQWTLPAGHRISGLWDATFTQQGRAVTVTNANWNAQIRADGSTSFGLNAVTSGGGAEPAQPTLTCRSTTA